MCIVQCITQNRTGVLNMTYEDVSRYTDLHDLIVNRVSLCNQLLGCKYDNSLDNPVLLRHAKGSYSVTIKGAMFATWHVYDLQQVEVAYNRLDGLYNGLWYLGSQNINQQL